jgi:hypothetical protein
LGAFLHIQLLTSLIACNQALRTPLKDAVDALPMDTETKKRFLAESLRVFQSNNEVRTALLWPE